MKLLSSIPALLSRPCGDICVQRRLAAGPLQLFAAARSRIGSAHRGRRHPAGAHGGVVGAARRLRCGARPGVAPHNSLRSLRSLRSNRCGESVYEARCARRPQACAPRHPTNRPCRVPPAAKATGVGVRSEDHRCLRKGAPGQAAARLRGAEERRPCGPRAQRASSSDSSHLSERSERSERSELCDGATRPSTAGQSVRSTDRHAEALPPARARLCRAPVSKKGSEIRQ